MQIIRILFFTLAVGCSTSLSQVYLTAPTGPNDTYNLYELWGTDNGILARFSPRNGDYATLEEAKQIAEQATESFTGSSISGQLVHVDDAKENLFLFKARYTGFFTFSEDSYQNFEIDVWPGAKFSGSSMLDDEFWKDVSGGSNFFIEYETQLPGPLPPVVGDLDLFRLEAPATKSGGFAVREISPGGCTHSQCNTAFGENVHFLKNLPDDANIYDYQVDVLDFVGLRGREGNFSDENFQFRSHDPNLTWQEPIALVAKAKISVTEANAGAWEFLVGSDDGFELLIHDQSFVHASVGSSLTPYGSLIYPGNRSFRTTYGVIELAEGTYDLEMLYWDRGGSSGLELAAKGPNDSVFELVGSSSSSLQVVPEPNGFASACFAAISFLLCSRRCSHRSGRFLR